MSPSGSDNSSHVVSICVSDIFVFQNVSEVFRTMRKVIICSKPQFWRMALAVSDRQLAHTDHS